jgi:putative SOS response-associated peptidase YedK
MCGRYTLTRPAAEVTEQFGLEQPPALLPRFNIAPTQQVFAVRRLPGEARPSPALLRWGLVPSWASDLSIGNRMLNARAETVAEKPAFRTAFLRRRCLIAADGFYEWRTVSGKKQPVHFRLRDGRLFAFAGLWERWAPPGGAAVESCTVLTTTANELVLPLHERMPVVLAPARYEAWLDPKNADLGLLQSWLAPWPAEDMTAAAASARVNNPRNEGPECLEAA